MHRKSLCATSFILIIDHITSTTTLSLLKFGVFKIWNYLKFKLFFDSPKYLKNSKNTAIIKSKRRKLVIIK